MIIRRNVKALTSSEKTAFTNAVLALKRRPSQMHPDDATRSRYDDYVEVHLNAMNAMMIGHVPNWGHLSSAFGPWHRVYLHHFEAELRMIDPSVSIPYWDWTDAGSTSAVFAPDFLGSNGAGINGEVVDGPFAYTGGDWKIVVKDGDDVPAFLTRRFGQDSSAPSLPSTAMQSRVMALLVYDQSPWYDSKRTPLQRRTQVDALFRFGLEYDLHNLVHRYIGGDMGLAASPNDPVFFLHHCNLDRLWSLWGQTTGRADLYEPQHNGPAGQSGDSKLVFHFQNSLGPWFGESMPQDVYHSREQIDVGYDTDPPDAGAFQLPATFEVMDMHMPSKMMYPLRFEYQTIPSRTPQQLFMLRSEFKSQGDVGTTSRSRRLQRPKS